MDTILKRLQALEIQVETISRASSQSKSIHEINVASAKHVPPAKMDDDDDDGVDLFASESDEEETEAAARIREERLKAYEAKKSKSKSLFL